MKFGICYRPHLHNQYLEEILEKISILEVMPEITSVLDMKKIKEKCSKKGIDIGIHSLRTSMFSAEGPQQNMLENYFYISEFLDSKYFSDHIAISNYHNYYLNSVQAIPYSDKNIQVFKNNLNYMRDFFPKNLYIENITQHIQLKESSMLESEFISRIVQETDVDTLFDVTNMFVTANNVGILFQDYIQDYPFERVKVLHVSGLSKNKDGHYVDIHSENICNDMLDIVRTVKDRLINLEYVLIERDFNVDTVNDIFLDLDNLKNIWE
ncbi:TPA: DUF692 family protein [Streptococcus agalactiae]|nr:DUF692 family protein [Streptococcus agalactiae]